MILRLSPPDSRATVVLLSVPIRVWPEDAAPEPPAPSTPEREATPAEKKPDSK